jgi:hypothetical protein
MKRDMDLVRTILIQLVEQPSDGAFSELHVEGHSDEEVCTMCGSCPSGDYL